MSINFVHNDKTWKDMHMIEEQLGRTIVCVDTSDVDVMEEVSFDGLHAILFLANDGNFDPQTLKKALKN